MDARQELHEEDLSDASLVEEDEEQQMDKAEEAGDAAAHAQHIGHARLSAVRSSTEDDAGSTSSSIIDLPGVPVTAPIEDGSAGVRSSTEGMEVEAAGKEEGEEEEDACEERSILPGSVGIASISVLDGFPDFHGWSDVEMAETRSKRAVKRRRFQTEFTQEELFEAGAYFAGKLKSKTAPQSQAKQAREQQQLQQLQQLQQQHLRTKNQQKSALPSPRPAIASPRALATMKATPSTAPPTAETSMASRRESREWRPSGVLFKPLTGGWIREVVYKQNADASFDYGTAPQIVYHAPKFRGMKPRQFRHIGELQHYLNSAEPTLSFHNFSFRREPMGAPAGQEVLRGENEPVEIFPPEPEKPPTPAAASRQKSVQKGTPAAAAAAAVTAAGAAAATATANGSNGSSGGLKLKMFSKMKEKNSLGSPPSSGGEASGIVSSPSLTVSRQKRNSAGTKKRSLPAGSAVAPPTVSITPVSAARGTARQAPFAGGSSSQAEFREWEAQQRGGLQQQQQQPQQQQPRSTGRPVLRPATFNAVSCNIHCPGVSGFPSLSCHSCHSMFHPRCVGLSEGVDYENHYDFYCAGCQPPPGKENLSGSPFSHRPSAPQATRRGAAPAASGIARKGQSGGGKMPPHGLPKGLSIIPSKGGSAAKGASPASYKQVNGLPGVGGSKAPFPPGSATARRSSSGASSTGKKGSLATVAPNSSAPAPIEAQSVVNIAGVKYLVVPHPPSKGSSVSAFEKKKPVPFVKDGGLAALAGTKAAKLLLKPMEGGAEMPSFEVEESPDGKLVLVPLGDAKGKENPFKKLKTEEKKEPDVSLLNQTATAGIGQCFHSNLNSSYHALLNVFKYLTLPERLRAARVCRLWRDLAYNQALWKSVSLKNVRVSSWPDAVAFLNRVRTRRLDMRRVVHPANACSPEESWHSAAKAFADLRTVRQLEFPRASASAICLVAGAVPRDRLQELGANSLAPREVELAPIAALSSAAGSLSSLRLRGAAGKLKIAGGLAPLTGLASSLTKLSLFGVENLSVSDLAVLPTLTRLSILELGDCSTVPTDDLLRAATSLSELTSLRLERARGVGAALGELRFLAALEKLELVDVALREGFGDGLVKLVSLRRVLLIPQYKDEVATINAEIVDSIPSMSGLTHFFLGLTNEWLQSMSTLVAAVNASGGGAGSTKKDSFPIMVGGTCEMFSLSKLFKTLSSAMPDCHVKILKMSQIATGKQFIENLLR